MFDIINIYNTLLGRSLIYWYANFSLGYGISYCRPTIPIVVNSVLQELSQSYTWLHFSPTVGVQLSLDDHPLCYL